MTNYSHDGKRVTIPAGATVLPNEMVKLSSNAVVPLTKGAKLYGVAMNGGTTGELITVAKEGVFRYTADTGVNFNYGDTVYGYTSLLVYKGTAAEYSVGSVVDTDPVTGGEVSVRITPSDDEVVIHGS